MQATKAAEERDERKSFALLFMQGPQIIGEFDSLLFFSNYF